MSIFSQAKGERDMKSAKDGAGEGKQTPDIVSTLGQGMLITGNIICAGSVQILGRVIGDIHAAQLVICEGAKVEGKVVAPDIIIQGVFNGTITGNNVKLLSTASVEGEIFNKSLIIEQDALFEGVARRLDKPVSPPTINQVKEQESAPALSPQESPPAEAVN